MKKLYTGAFTVAALLLNSLSSSAQTYSGGTYTAVTAGKWHNTSGSIWQPVEPPQTCNNCLIQLLAPGVDTLNTTVTLTNGSKLVVGGSSTGTTLLIPNSGASTWAAANNILLDGTGTGSSIVVTDNTSILDASGAGELDGVLQTTPGGGGTTNYLKEYGNAPLLLNGTTVTNSGNAADGKTMTGPATLGSSGDLPVILADFTATVNSGSVGLAWTTDLEVNSDHFTVQVSSNSGESWSNLGTVAAAGNSASPINYSFTDNHPAQGTNEFRLEMVDRNGRIAYSDVKAVRIGMLAAVSAYPNPASDYVNVTLTGEANLEANIRLVNLAGQVLLQKDVTNAGGTTVALAVSSFPAGNYLVVVTGSDGSQQVTKVLIAR